MRPSCIPLLASLAFLGLTQGKANGPSVKTVCNTAYCGVKGTRTQYLADETVVIQKPAPPCKVTTTAVITPRPKIITSIQPVVSTTTITEPQQTDIATTTSFDFQFVFPTTTSYTTVTPVFTSTVVVANPSSDTVTTVTSYTVPAPSPTFTNQRRGEGKIVEPRGGSKNFELGPGFSPAHLGKKVYCHREVTTTTTITKPCKTVTSYSNAPRPTSTTVSTFLVQVTATAFLSDATSTVTIFTPTTVTAPTNTFTVTEFAPTSTTTSTTTAAVATTTVVIGEYALCNPSRFSLHRQVGALHYSSQGFSANDPVSCCHAAFSVPNAVLFYSGNGVCGAWYNDIADYCPVPVVYDDTGSDPYITSGIGTCGLRA